MKFTKEEELRLTNHLSSVAEFIRDEIQSRMAGTDITVDFGAMENYPNFPYREKKWHLYVSDRGCSIRSGGLTGIPVIPAEPGSEDSRLRYYSLEAGMCLLREWEHVKSALLTHIEEIGKEKRLLDTFKI